MYCVNVVIFLSNKTPGGQHHATESGAVEVEVEDRSRLDWRTMTLRPPWQPLSSPLRLRIQPRGARSILIPGVLLDVSLHLDTARPPQEPVAVIDRVLMIRDTFAIKTHL